MNPRELGMSALFGAVVLFVAAMVILSRNVAQIREDYRWMEHTNAVLTQVNDVDAMLAGVELTVRGYALTGSHMFITLHGWNHQKLFRAMDVLGRSLDGEPVLQHDYTTLKAAIEHHEALYDTLIGTGPERREIVAEAIVNPVKRQHRDVALVTLDHMRKTETALLDKQHREAEERTSSTYRLAIGITGFAFLTGTLGFALTLFGWRASGR